MIQFKRGSSSSWSSLKEPLADGQPGYDKNRNKIKIGDGKKTWSELPYASGLLADEILDKESDAKEKTKQKAALNPLNAIATKIFKLEDRPIFTYGSELPDKDTVGQIYLQHYETEPETDYIISQGKNGIWTYQIWHSGMARCWGTVTLSSPVQNAFDKSFLYCNSTNMTQVNYPIPFLETPCETATLKSPSGTLAWVASYTGNSKEKTGLYKIISPYSQSNKTYGIILDVKGFINKAEWL